MVWIYANEKPEAVEVQIVLGQRQRKVNYCVESLKEGEYKWRCRQVTLPPGVWNYSAIVDALITAEYPSDKMQSVVNNYLCDPNDEEYNAEMLKMQEWRATAKEIAHGLTDGKGGEA